jgi:hypothetical protein
MNMKLPKVKFPARLTSRKLWLAVIASVVAFGNSYWDWGLSADEVWAIIIPLLAFVGVEGVADTAERLK